MTKKFYLFPHNPKSEGAAELASALEIKRIKQERSAFKGSKTKIVINWGNSSIDNEEILKCKILNDPKAVSLCTNKLTFFKHVDGKVNTPQFTTDIKKAIEWITKDEAKVVARKILNGSGGAGITIMTRENHDNFVQAPLYTKYIPKLEEYRVHVIGNKIIDVQQKALRNGWVEENGPANYLIRNITNGFIYKRENIKPAKEVVEQALLAISSCGLDFGAVDVIWNEKQSTAYVLEVNTAPGLEGTTVENYANGFKAQ